jgi:bifunctional DNase/RNase
MMIEMKVASLTVDPFNSMPILILTGLAAEPDLSLPLWIGMGEATAIAAELESIRLDRPMTHDLMKTILGLCDIEVDRVEIHDLKSSTFFATLYLKRPDGAPLAVDARPSDAIALALRARAPIFVAKKVLDKARKNDPPLPVDAELGPDVDGVDGVDGVDVADVLAGLSETAFGKWKM